MTETAAVLYVNRLLCADDAQRADMWRELTRDVWRTRLKGVQRNVDVWQALLSVRQLVLPMHEDAHTHLKFASLCRKSGRVKCANVHGPLQRCTSCCRLPYSCKSCPLALRCSCDGGALRFSHP